MKIGVAGNGFVGDAVASFFRQREEVLVWDILPERSEVPLETLLTADIIFVCLPTPTKEDGTQDQTALWDFAESACDSDRLSLLIIKSTVTPGTTASMALSFPGLQFVMNPEFLTARTARQDFAQPTDIVLGGGATREAQEALLTVTRLYERYFPDVPMLCCDHTTAEMIKYTRNSFYAAKVAFFNEIYRLCQELDVDYETVRKGMLASTWINPMHTVVPGPDGKLGFGGACLPKDSRALASLARQVGADLYVLEAAITSNKKIRGE